MEKISYKANRKLIGAYYLTALGVFLTLLIISFVMAVITKNETERSKMCIASIGSLIGFLFGVFGLYAAIHDDSFLSFAMVGAIASTISLILLLNGLVPVLSDPNSVRLNGWGIASISIFVLLISAGIFGGFLPNRHLFTKKMLLIITMTALTAIQAISFVSDVVSFVQNGLPKAAALSVLSAYTHLAPIFFLGIGIAYIYDTTIEKKE